MKEKWVLWCAGTYSWSTASDDYHQTIRLALRHFGIPDAELMKDDKYIRNKWLSFINGRHDQPAIVTASLERGGGKPEEKKPEERKAVGFRMGNAEKVYPISILHMVYDDQKEEAKSAFVTRASAEAALTELYERSMLTSTELNKAKALLEDKPRVKAKAGSTPVDDRVEQAAKNWFETSGDALGLGWDNASPYIKEKYREYIRELDRTGK